jgi:hypothetical protein
MIDSQQGNCFKFNGGKSSFGGSINDRSSSKAGWTNGLILGENTFQMFS